MCFSPTHFSDGEPCSYELVVAQRSACTLQSPVGQVPAPRVYDAISVCSSNAHPCFQSNAGLVLRKCLLTMRVRPPEAPDPAPKDTAAFFLARKLSRWYCRPLQQRSIL
jgi:hypothetical protein